MHAFAQLVILLLLSSVVAAGAIPGVMDGLVEHAAESTGDDSVVTRSLSGYQSLSSRAWSSALGAIEATTSGANDAPDTS